MCHRWIYGFRIQDRSLGERYRLVNRFLLWGGSFNRGLHDRAWDRIPGAVNI